VSALLEKAVAMREAQARVRHLLKELVDELGAEHAYRDLASPEFVAAVGTTGCYGREVDENCYALGESIFAIVARLQGTPAQEALLEQARSLMRDVCDCAKCKAVAAEAVTAAQAIAAKELAK